MTRLAVVLLAALAVLAGCASGPPKIPTVTFEAPGFIRRYMAERDGFIRRTAAAHLRCERSTAESPVALRTKCEKLAGEEKAWAEQDEIVMTQILAGQVVKSFDMEKAAELLLKVVATAADIAL